MSGPEIYQRSAHLKIGGNLRRLVRCNQCNRGKTMREVKTDGFPEYILPSTWITVKDKIVCSFKCAKRVYCSIENKNWLDVIVAKFFGVMTKIPGVR